MSEDPLSRRAFVRLGTAASALGIGITAASATKTIRDPDSGSDRARTPKEVELANTPQSHTQVLRPYPGRVEPDIWVFTGQSNSQGWALLKAPIQPDPGIMFFDENNEW